MIINSYVFGGTPPPSEAYRDLILAENPVFYSRCDNNAANSTVTDISASAADGTLVSVINGSGGGSGSGSKNTSLVSTPGLLTTSANLGFDLAGSSVVQSPFYTLSDVTGWTVIFPARPDAEPAAGNSGVSTLCQLGDSGGSAGLDVWHVSGTTFQLRLMRSGVALVASTSPTTWTYGDKLWVVIRQLAGGNIEVWVDNVKVLDVSGSGIAQVLGSFWWGASRYGGADTYFPLIGPMDELAVIPHPITDGVKNALWAEV